MPRDLDEIVGAVLMRDRQVVGSSRDDLIMEVMDRMTSRGVPISSKYDPYGDLAYMGIDQRFEIFYSNRSPCWKCAGSEGEIVFDEEDGGYFHERCLL